MIYGLCWMRAAALAVVCLVATAGVGRAGEAPLAVTNLKFGLVCGDANNRRVCFQSGLIQVTNESRCTFNQKVIPCTWYGFSFDYDTPADVKVDCVASVDEATNLGNPKEALKPGNKSEFSLSLRQGKHHFFLAQYISGEAGPSMPKQAKEACSLAGKELFSAEYQYEFTDHAQPVESVPDMSGEK